MSTSQERSLMYEVDAHYLHTDEIQRFIVMSFVYLELIWC